MAKTRKNWTQINYSEEEAAGVKLLASAIMRNAEAVAKRYKNERTRELCHTLTTAADQMIQAVDGDAPFTVCILQQQALFDWSITDDGYGVIE
jgi:hypothetical protein